MKANLHNSRFVFFHAFEKFGHSPTSFFFLNVSFFFLASKVKKETKPATILMVYDLTNEYIVQIGFLELAFPSFLFGSRQTFWK